MRFKEKLIIKNDTDTFGEDEPETRTALVSFYRESNDSNWYIDAYYIAPVKQLFKVD